MFGDEGDEYDFYYSGSGYTENTDNPGNNDPDSYPPLYTDFPGTLDVCTAVQSCADQSDNDPTNYFSFDLHYLCSNQTWVCVQYFNDAGYGNYFNVPDDDVVAAYGYNYNNNS